ncbi:uncharacterized protein LOC110658579 isoform X2 [Hevea brasiliensis]|uniref:uncharacterized protein LOC110658579 isoform X2 n=1 Tax=Hevea brasiliensis TaxID=3981 RepID=UPI0025D39854|nr:uncharacterized protein LOC110658579 isoform X2 [Hevea brasiliensis]
MGLGSSEIDVEDISHLQRQCGSTSAGELDVDFTGGREVEAEGCVFENSVATCGLQVDSNQLGTQGSSSLPDDFKIENLESPVDNFRLLPTEFTYHQQMQPPLKDEDCQGEMDELSGSYFQKTSFQFMAKTSHSERGTEGSAHSQELPITVDDSQPEKLEGKSNLDRLKTTEKEEVNVSNEKPNWRESEPKNGNCHSRNTPTESGRMDVAHLHPHSSGNTSKHSALPPTLRQMSPEKPVHTHQSPEGHGPLSSQEGFLESSDPPTSCRPRKSSSRERSSRHKRRQSSSPKRSDQAKKVPSRDHLSSSTKQTSASPHRSQYKDGSSQNRRSASPKFRKSPRKYGRLEKSVSRSPIRKRDSSSGYKRDRRGRSRSSSPHVRDRHKSPRVRNSPRQRSPPGYHSSLRSPRQRPWVPPPNRRTGLGKLGNNLFVAGFSFLTTERDLERKFSRFGRVRDVRIVRDKRGFSWIWFFINGKG